MLTPNAFWLSSGTITPNGPHEWWTHARALFGSKLTYDEHVARYCTTKTTKFGTQITGANPARLAELAQFLAPYVLRRTQQQAQRDLPSLLWALLPVAPSKVPLPEPSIGEEVIRAILGKLEREEALSLTEQMHLSSLLRWTGLAKAPAVVEIARDEIATLKKLVIFAWHADVVDALKDGLGDIAAVIDGRTPQRLRQPLIDQFQTTEWPQVLIAANARGRHGDHADRGKPGAVRRVVMGAGRHGAVREAAAPHRPDVGRDRARRQPGRINR